MRLGHRSASGGNQARSVRVRSTKAGSSQSVNPPLPRDRETSSKTAEPSSGVSPLPLPSASRPSGPAVYIEWEAHRSSDSNHRRRASISVSHPRTSATIGERLHTQTSSSGSITMALDRPSQPLRVSPISTSSWISSRVPGFHNRDGRIQPVHGDTSSNTAAGNWRRWSCIRYPC